MHLYPQSRPSAAVCALLLSCLALSGCAGAMAVTPDAAGMAVDKTYGLFRQGKVESHQQVNLDEMIAKTRNAAVELDLTYVKEEKHPDQLKLIYNDMRKQEITITLVRRTQTVTEMHVDVGIFGDAGMGQLVMGQMLRQLEHPAGANPATATAP